MDNPVWAYIFGPPKEKKAMIELLRSLPAFEGLSNNELVQIDAAEFRILARAESQQTLNDIGTAPALFVDDVQILPVILCQCFIFP